MNEPRMYLVDFRGPLTPTVNDALAAAGATLLGSTGGGQTAPGGPLPEPDHHYTWITAADEHDAKRRLSDALAGRGTVLNAKIADPDDVA